MELVEERLFRTELEEDNYEVKLLLSGCVPGLIHSYIRMSDQKKYLYYDAREPIILYPIKDDELIFKNPFKYFKILLEAVIRVRDYLLDIDKLWIDINCIYLNKSRDKAFLIYSPKVNTPFFDEIRSLVEELIEKCDLKIGKNALFLNRIYEIVCNNKDSKVLLKELWEYINEYDGTDNYVRIKLRNKNNYKIFMADIYSGKSVSIGRQEGAEIRIGGSTVSRVHAKLSNVKSELYITDMFSTNGTYVNSHRLKPEEAEKLNDKDVIRFADEEYSFINVDG
ncbi:MAG: FHA domain-containing protein [Lachnospiraceae bacterium]|nr:FHA domain-containing protein [Lachnospiraceae bacterium]